MKNQFITIGVAVMLALGLTSCSKDEVKPLSVGQQQPVSQEHKISGEWVVSSFEINGAEHSDFYTPYIFTFKDDGVVAAAGSGKMIPGKWSMGTVKDHQSLSLDFGDVDPLNLLKAHHEGNKRG
jgi:hypothetical protein